MIIEVTQEDIDAGKRSSAYTCPIAYALARATGKPVAVTAEYSIVDGERYIEHTKSVIKFIDTFDIEGHDAVKPHRFRLEYVA